MIRDMSAAEIIEQIRASGQSRRALGISAGVPTTTISRIETGASDATIGMIERLAAAAGMYPQIVLHQMPTLADAADVGPNSDSASWLRLRLAAEAATSQLAAKAVITPRPDTDDMWSLNLLAGVAERIAHLAGIDPPAWCNAIGPLETTWHPSGTPRMIQRSHDTAPPELLHRGIALGSDSIWSDA